MSRVALDHLVAGLEAGLGEVVDGGLLVLGLLRGDEGCVGDEGEVDAGVGDQVRLELRQVHVQRSVETQRRRHRAHDLQAQTPRLAEQASG